MNVNKLVLKMFQGTPKTSFTSCKTCEAAQKRLYGYISHFVAPFVAL